MQRSRGVGHVGFVQGPDKTVLSTLHQAGSAKIRLPKVYGARHAEAVLINTSGGLTDGDLFETSVSVGAGAEAVVTSQACEKIYRALDDDPARIDSTLRVEAGGSLAWLPQESIVYDGGRVDRLVRVELQGDADFVGVESLILGRESMGESVTSGSVCDRWQVRRDGKLIFADGFALEGDIAAAIERPAVLAGNRYLSTIVCCRENAQSWLEPVREALQAVGAGAATAFGGKLIARIACSNGRLLRRAIVAVLTILRGGTPMPRVWHI